MGAAKQALEATTGTFGAAVLARTPPFRMLVGVSHRESSYMGNSHQPHRCSEAGKSRWRRPPTPLRLPPTRGFAAPTALVVSPLLSHQVSTAS